jgi:16S rRNA G966 N2-methylase RsmD
MEHAPYQTIYTPHMHIDGRRLDDRWPIDYDFRGKTVLDLGARDGMNSIRALEAGASRCTLVDHDFTSLTWQVIDDCGVRNRCAMLPSDATKLPPQGCDVVLAFSVVAHIGVEALAVLALGKDILLETHAEADSPPDTGHRWRLLGQVSYSRAEPGRKRSIYLGLP